MSYAWFANTRLKPYPFADRGHRACPLHPITAEDDDTERPCRATITALTSRPIKPGQDESGPRPERRPWAPPRILESPKREPLEGPGGTPRRRRRARIRVGACRGGLGPFAPSLGLGRRTSSHANNGRAGPTTARTAGKSSPLSGQGPGP